jgi:phage gp36-like protein
MVQRFGEPELLHLTDAGRTGSIDATIVSMALDDATAEVDSYLSSVLSAPLTTTPVILVSVTCDVARYRLYSGIGGQTEQVKDRYDAAVRWLRDVSAGKAKLGIATADVPITRGIAASIRTFEFTDDRQTQYSNLTNQQYIQ